MKMQETKLVDPRLLDPAQTGLEAQEFEARLCEARSSARTKRYGRLCAFTRHSRWG